MRYGFMSFMGEGVYIQYNVSSLLWLILSLFRSKLRILYVGYKNGRVQQTQQERESCGDDKRLIK